MAGLRVYVDWEKEMQYFIIVSNTGKPGLSIPGSTKRLLARNKSAGGLPKKISCGGGQVLSLRHKRLGPSTHLVGPLALCNPNEKQKPPPLDNSRPGKW